MPGGEPVEILPFLRGDGIQIDPGHMEVMFEQEPGQSQRAGSRDIVDCDLRVADQGTGAAEGFFSRACRGGLFRKSGG